MEELRWKPTKTIEPVVPRTVQVSASVCSPIPYSPAQIMLDAYIGISRSMFQAFGIIFGLVRKT